jgi:hypothetical protein
MELSATGLIFNPVVPVWVLAIFAVLIVGFFIFGLLKSAKGAWLRLLAGLVLLAAFADPKLSQELRDPLSDVALLLVDESASQTIDNRAELTAEASEALQAAAEKLIDPNAPLELRVATVSSAAGHASDDPGTRLFTAMETALADVGEDRVAGAILITDGRAHDAPDWSALDEEAIAARFPAPLHILSTGREGSYDRRLILESAPAFGIVGEDVSIRLRIEDIGETPAGAPPAQVSLRIDGKDVRRDVLTVGSATTISAKLNKGGASVFELIVAELDGEITTRNNRALFTVQGARDRLRVLLVSGEPHAGERSWRNLLKADPSVDLVHFTILRPPTKMSGTPIRELSLIPFPTRELFMQKIDDFDLVIFDRYTRRGVLAPAYLANVADYVRKGGATLIAAGPNFGGPNSLYRSPLADIMPATPTGGSVEKFFTPLLTDPGTKHPVTADLPQAAEEPEWGRWARLIDIAPRSGDTLMAGQNEEPLLVLDRVGEGRVAILASDTAWLWSRGFEGGGPLAEMLRRVAHWLMKEPQLEEDALTAITSGSRIEITRRSLGEAPKVADVVTPSGNRAAAQFRNVGPGKWQAVYEAEEAGLFSITDGVLETSAAVGPPSPKEFENPLATFDLLRPISAVTGGAEIMLRDAGIPDLRRVSGQRKTSGTGWIGLRERGAYVVRDATLTPLAPGWLALLIAAGLLLGAWRMEGR